MGNIFGLIGALIPIALGVYLILYFGGFKAPNSTDTEKLEKFNSLKTKHGKKIVLLGIINLIYGVYNLIQFLYN